MKSQALSHLKSLHQVKKLEQLSLEEETSLQAHRAKVLQGIRNNPEMCETAHKIATRLQAFIGQTGLYASKQARFRELSNNIADGKYTYKEISTFMLSILLPLQRWSPIQSPSGILAEFLRFNNIFDGVRTAAELITQVSIVVPYIEIQRGTESHDGMINVRCNAPISGFIKEFLKQSLYVPPSIAEPRAIKANWHSGYLTQKGSVILGKGNHHKLPLSIEALNIASQVELELDLEVLTDIAPFSSKMDTPEKQQQHITFMKECSIIFKKLVNLGNRFYFTWKFDKRGRMYSQGYHVNIQGTEYQKACISLANKEVIK